jgi:hypothetical protein
MLIFAESPGDHRSLCFDISTRSLLGEFRFKIYRPVNRRLVTSQQASVRRYNETVCEQFAIHRLERLDAVDKITRYCGYPSPGWLRAMIIKLYKQMTEIRVHAEKKCRKILRPESDYPNVVRPHPCIPPANPLACKMATHSTRRAQGRAAICSHPQSRPEKTSQRSSESSPMREVQSRGKQKDVVPNQVNCEMSS